MEVVDVIARLHRLLHFFEFWAMDFIYLAGSSHRQSHSHTPITLDTNIKQEEVNIKDYVEILPGKFKE